MGNIIFYNSERTPIMQWHNFLLVDGEKEDVLTFDVKIQKSIFTVAATYKTNLKDLLALKNHINLLYQQRIHKIVYFSLNELLRVELEWEDMGRIKQKFVVIEEHTGSCLEVECFFDQTFLPELEANMDDMFIEIKNVEKCHE